MNKKRQIKIINKDNKSYDIIKLEFNILNLPLWNYKNTIPKKKYVKVNIRGIISEKFLAEIFNLVLKFKKKDRVGILKNIYKK